MSKINSWINKPRYENLAKFGAECITLIDLYWDMANQDRIQTIEKAYSNTLVDKELGDKNYYLAQQSTSDIAKHFHELRLREYDKIDEKTSKVMRERISKFINSNIANARDLDLIIPENILTNYQIYYNYTFLKRVLPTIESLITTNKSK